MDNRSYTFLNCTAIFLRITLFKLHRVEYLSRFGSFKEWNKRKSITLCSNACVLFCHLWNAILFNPLVSTIRIIITQLRDFNFPLFFLHFIMVFDAVATFSWAYAGFHFEESKPNLTTKRLKKGRQSRLHLFYVVLVHLYEWPWLSLNRKICWFLQMFALCLSKKCLKKRSEGGYSSPTYVHAHFLF